MTRGIKKKPEVIRAWVDQIIPVLQRGTSFRNACAYLQIPHSTFWDYVQKDETIRTKIVAAENYLDVLSETTIATAIQKGDVNSAKWRMERTQKNKYGIKTTTEIEGGVDINITTNVKMPNKE